jgi:hypothetical protein
MADEAKRTAYESIRVAAVELERDSIRKRAEEPLDTHGVPLTDCALSERRSVNARLTCADSSNGVDILYTAPMYIGTPGQPFNMVPDSECLVSRASYDVHAS